MTDSKDGGSQWTFLSPDDGYKYNNVEISQEGMLTEPLSFPPTGSLPSVGLPSVPATEPRPAPGLAQNANDEALGPTKEVPYKPYIGQRPTGHRRAKVPDLEKGRVSEEPTSANGHGYQVQNNSQDSGRQPSGNSITQQKEPHIKYVKLNWKMARDELLLNIGPPKSEPSEAELPKRVLWRHSEHKIMSIKKLQESLNHFESRGLSKGEVALTRRLLKRVHTISERQFVGGSFLTPSASRYDSKDLSKYTVDKTCIFFNFPYLCVANSRTRVYLKKGELEHPPRTLLQSHYRLNKTKERDEKQCIGLLKENVVRSCINEPDMIRGRASGKLTDEMVFVPQFWGLIVGLDTMITCGPIDDTALRSSAIQLIEPSSASDGDKLSLVRILFTDQGRLEDLLYPIEQCGSWFGLLNKQQQILGILGSDRAKVDPDDYKLSHGGEIVTIDNWASMLCKSRSFETLDLWMRKDIPQIRVQSAEVSQTLGERPSHQAHDASFIKDQCSHMVTPFLGWPVKDEFGEPDPLPPTERADKFLRAIYINLPTGDVMSVQERAMRPTLASAQRIAAKGRTEISQNTLVEVRSRWTTTERKGISLELFQYFELILIFFLPEPEKANSAPLETYWGAVDEILENFCKPHLAQQQADKYSAMLSSIIFNARRLHHGVYCPGPNKDPLPADGSLSNGAILLAVMVDALGAIFHLLVETVEIFRTDNRQIIDGIMEPKSKVSKYGEEACQFLEQARDQLIREADGIASVNSIGPVVTPEAITITILQRLVAGVFRNGSVEIIGLYEECLEYLAFKVERQASRKLLQKINAFLEEITIVNHVLKQQIQVLMGLRQSLDPATFQPPSIARKLRYEFECRGIDKIVQTIKEQRKYCEELHERAKTLSEQNVQLVETLQDNINKAVFIFTVVTITFLPMGFVAGYFGMNLAGISSTTRPASDFWFIALPVTFGVLVMGSIFAFKGEEVFFVVEGVLRRLKGLLSHRE